MKTDNSEDKPTGKKSVPKTVVKKPKLPTKKSIAEGTKVIRDFDNMIQTLSSLSIEFVAQAVERLHKKALTLSEAQQQYIVTVAQQVKSKNPDIKIVLPANWNKLTHLTRIT